MLTSLFETKHNMKRIHSVKSNNSSTQSINKNKIESNNDFFKYLESLRYAFAALAVTTDPGCALVRESKAQRVGVGKPSASIAYGSTGA